MRLSQLFSETFREAPADITLVGHQLLLRAGYVRYVDGGRIALLPLGLKVVQAIQSEITKNLSYLKAQEVLIPARGQPASPGQLKIEQLNPFPLHFASDSLAILASLLGGMIHSHRQLPRSLFQIKAIVRDDYRQNAALFYPREDSRLSIYHLAASDSALRQAWQSYQDALLQFCSSLGLDVCTITAGLTEETTQQAFQLFYPHLAGNESVLFCTNCDYAANSLSTGMRKETPENETALPLEEVATPQVKTIHELSACLHVPKTRTAKAVFYMAELSARTQSLFIFALLRGDLGLNEFKLKQAIQRHTHQTVISLTPATDTNILRIGGVPGFASPIGIARENVLLIADDSIPGAPNLVAGANHEGFHLLNSNYGRDYTADVLCDIALAEDGGGCPNCGQVLNLHKGFTLAQTWLPGSVFGEALGLHFQAEDGASRPLSLATTEMGLFPLLAAVAETHHDQYGLTLPIALAPYLVHLIVLGESTPVVQTAEELYQELSQRGFKPLLDDRDERAGVKFNDADLIGAPIRLTISERSMEKGGVEMKLRKQDEREIIPLPGLVERIKQILESLSPVN